MEQHMITPNETLQLNELLTLKSLSMTKSLVMSPMIADPDLKALMKKDADICEGHIRELRGYMAKSKVYTTGKANVVTSPGGYAL